MHVEPYTVLRNLALDLFTRNLARRNIYIYIVVTTIVMFAIRQCEAMVSELRRSLLEHSTHRRDHRSPQHCLNPSGQMHYDRHDVPRVAESTPNNLHDPVHVFLVGSGLDMYYTDPARQLIIADLHLDHLDRHLLDV